MSLRRLALLFATLLVSTFVGAATVEDRSPFRQGHWWDPTRSGHGFELLNTSGGVMAVWYTYDGSGAPTWYTAQGSLASMGTIWPLQKHRWGNGRIVESTDAGIIRLRVDHFERITASWQLDGAQQTWILEPFVQSGVVNEVDLTGHWYDTANSGWGMTLLDQGDVFGAVIYTYDPAGQPTWVAGFDRGKGTRIDLYKTRGTCPGCVYRAAIPEPAGAIDIGYRGDTSVTVRGAPNLAMAPDLRIDGAQVSQLGRPASTRRGDYQLATFARAETLRTYLVGGMGNRRFAGGSDFSAAPPAGPSSFSTTNTQEAGVDEADVVKTDGRILFSITTATTVGLGAKVRIVDVGPGGSLVQPMAEFHSYQVANAYNVDNGLYLHAGNLVTLASNYYYGGWLITPPELSETLLEILDVTHAATPRSRWRARVSGSMVSSRRIGDRLYLVTRFTPSVPGYNPYAYTDAMRAANVAALAAVPVEALLPRITVNEGNATPLVGIGAVHAPQLGGALPVADMVVITVIDLREARVVDSLAIVGRTEAIYVSPSNLYVASMRYNSVTHPTTQASLYNTDVHQIAIGGDRLRLVGSGSIEGLVGWGDKASFRFGEHGGKLAVVSSLQNGWWGTNSNRVTILEPSTAAPGLLKTVSHLPNRTRPEPLGKPNERLYGTRFVGDKLYAVTFMQVDPLYIVDLANKADPKITGALEIPGFSDYLHPLPNGLLLGFGRDATSNGLFQGLQMTLFDVSGTAPRQIEQVLMGKRGSDSALFASHRAFSTLARADGSTLVAFPAAIHDGPLQPESWASYPWHYSGLLTFEVRGTTPENARLVQSQTLVTERPSSAADMYGYGSYDTRSWSGRGRSVLFPDASYFVGGNGVWRMDNRSGDTIGPY